MRIAFLCRSLPVHRQGGMEWHAWDLARGLAQRGHSLQVVTTPFGRPEKNTPLARQLAQPGLTLFETGLSTAGRYTFPYFRESDRLVTQWARNGKIDLVHAQGFAALFLDPARLGSIPLIATIHGTWWSETLLDHRARGDVSGYRQLALVWRYRRRVVLRPAYKRFIKRPRFLIVDSAFTRDELLRDHPALEPRIRVVPLGVDLERFPLVEPGKAGKRRAKVERRLKTSKPTSPVPATGRADHRPVRLLALGRLEPSKGFEVALRALAGCRGRNWVLRIGGEGPERPHLESIAEREGLAVLNPGNRPDSSSVAATPSLSPLPRVEFLGRVPDNRLAGEFAEADLFLNPDLTQPAFGLVALEAMLQGTPVLAARVGAMPEVLGPSGGWLVPAADVEAWTRTLDSLLADPDGLVRQGHRARRSALRRFSLDRMVEAVQGVYSEALAKAPPEPWG